MTGVGDTAKGLSLFMLCLIRAGVNLRLFATYSYTLDE